MNKFWKQTMALFMAFALVFGTLVPVVAWAEEPANVVEPTVESESETPAEQPAQTEPEEQLPEKELEGKETEAPEELELSKEETPAAQGSAPEDPANIFVLTKRTYNDPNAPEEKIGEYKTLKEAVMGCTQDDLDNLYIITMFRDYMVPDAEKSVERGSLHYLLRSAGASPHTLKKEGTDTVFDLGNNNTLEVQNVILDGNKDGQCFFMWGNAEVTLGGGTVVQNFVDTLDRDGPAIYLSGTSTLTIEPEVVITENKSDQTEGYFAGVIYAAGNSTVNIKGGKFTNNRSNGKDGGVIRSGSDAVVNIYDGTFKHNTAKKTGGVILAYGAVNIYGGTFEENKASTGGAVYAKKALIQNAKFLTNKAKWGGAVFVAQEATIQNSVFTSNTASSAGGALYVSGVTKIADSEFQSNNSKQGGAIYSKGELNVADTSFTQNEANDGGAVLAIAKMAMTGDTFTSNKAKELGGAVVIADVAEITKSKFESNEAQNGGALHISAEDTNVTITESIFKNNHAEHQGGAISDEVAQYANVITDSKAYRNLTTDAKTLFQGNKADGGLFNPPENYEEFTNLQFDPNSDVKHEILTRESLLNNYDVNYKNDLLLATFRANGGAFSGGVTIITDEYEKGATINPPAAPVRRDYTFAGWLDEDGKNADFTQTIDRNRVFTAKWDKDESMPPTPSRDERIIVDPNGGTFSDGTTGRKTYDLKAEETFVLPAAPTREGYKFIAWEGKSGTYQPGDKYTVQRGGDVFIARWEEEKKPEEKPSVKPNIKTPKGTPLTPDEIAKILQGMKKTVPAIPRAGVGK